MSTQSVLTGTSVEGFGTFLVTQSFLTEGGNISYTVDLELDDQGDAGTVSEAIALTEGVIESSVKLFGINGTTRFQAMFTRHAEGLDQHTPADELFLRLEASNSEIDRSIERVGHGLAALHAVPVAA